MVCRDRGKTVKCTRGRFGRCSTLLLRGEGPGKAYTLVSYMRLLLEKRRAALAQFLGHAVLENRSEGMPRLGPGALVQLPSELCRKHGASFLLHVGGCGETAASGFCSGKGLQPAEER
ncbi:MAG: hypothetical protein LM590_15410 [Thermofilum sp.]|nr:hypothetical protein [Thermofilum sp.]